MDFNHPWDEPDCDSINFSFSNFARASFRSPDISVVGNDIIIGLVIKRGGGGHHTVTVKDAVLHGVVVDESNITFEHPNR